MNTIKSLALILLATTLAACGGGGGGGSAPPATPTATLSVDKSTVDSGGTVMLTWSSTGATACTASGAWTGTLATSGTQASAALTSDATFTLTCNGAGGNSTPATAAVTVNPAFPGAPTVTISASPTSVTSGGTSTLTWSSTNATTCTASGGWSGTQATSGSVATSALTGNTTFILTCSGTVGAGVANTTVTVTNGASNAPVVTLTAAPTGVPSGSATQLIWSTLNATACTASDGWTGAQPISGRVSTGALTAAKNYTLSCTGAGGTGNATVAVSIVTASMSPVNAAMATGQLQTFTKTGSDTVNYLVDGLAGGNSSVGTIDVNGLYTAGTSVGPHTVSAATTTDGTVTQTALAIVTDLAGITTYHGNDQRDGTNVKEYALTTVSVKPATFGKLASCTLDGAVAAQPLWVAQQNVNGNKRNVVYVATQHDSLYAIDADASPCLILWTMNLADTSHGAAAGETPVPWTLVGQLYGDIQPEIGITGTPVIDLPNKILYVVSKSINAGQTTMYTRLHALDLTTGAEKAGSPVAIAGSVPGTGTNGTTVVFDDKQQLQRPGLALAGGTVYVAFAAHEDKDPWFGWVFGYTYASGAWSQTAKFNAAPNGKGAGIWMSAGAPAIDASNNLYLLTGNGVFNADSTLGSGQDYGDSLLKLSPSLAVSAYWTPSTQNADRMSDNDFGSGGATVLADLPTGSTVQRVVMGGGKEGFLEVLNRDALGGYQATTGLPVQELALNGPLFSTVGFWNNQLYVAVAGQKLTQYTLNQTTVQFAIGTTTPQVYSWPGATPTISARGTSDGIVWAMEQNTYCTLRSNGSNAACGPAILHAYDALNLATELWKSSAVPGDVAGFAMKFSTPTVANGHVYIGTRGNNAGGDNSSTNTPGTLEIYGLKP